MSRVLILGGRGCVGRRVAVALRELPELDVVLAGRESRSGEAGDCIAVDLRDSANLKALAGFDFVVNCTDGSALPPDRAAAYCLHSGSTFIELSAHADVVQRLWTELGDDPDPKGRVILGGGLFPGLSNVLAADLVRRTPERLERLEIGVRMSPFSAAGRGTCRAVADVFARPAERVVDSRPWRHEPLRVAGSLPTRSGPARAVSVGLAEARMVHWSTDVASTGALLVTSPWPASLQRLAITLLPWRALGWGPVRWLVGSGAYAIRGGLFRWRDAPLELVAVGNRGLSNQVGLSLSVRHGLAGVGSAAASILQTVRENPSVGVFTIDQLVEPMALWRHWQQRGGSVPESI